MTEEIGWSYTLNGVESRAYESQMEANKYFCINLMESRPDLMALAKASHRLTWDEIFDICGVD